MDNRYRPHAIAAMTHGEYVLERLAERMREALANAELLEAYAAILEFGFMGRTRAKGNR